MTVIRSIQLHVKDELIAFFQLDERECFSRNHQDLIDDLRKEQWQGGNEWKPNYQCFEDFAFVSEMARFLDDLELWNERVDEIRQQYFYDKITNELPEKYLLVFGFTSKVTKRLDYLKKRCKVLVDGIESICVTAERTISKQDLAKMIGKKDSAINAHMKKGLKPLNPGGKPLVFDFEHAREFYKKEGINLQ